MNKEILINGLVKCYLEASKMSGDSKFLIPSNFSLIASSQLRGHNIQCIIDYIGGDKFLVKYWAQNIGKGEENEILFDAKLEVRNNRICSIIN